MPHPDTVRRMRFYAAAQLSCFHFRQQAASLVAQHRIDERRALEKFKAQQDHDAVPEPIPAAPPLSPAIQAQLDDIGAMLALLDEDHAFAVLDPLPVYEVPLPAFEILAYDDLVPPLPPVNDAFED